MLRENTVFAQKIIEFYTDKGVDCSVVDEHSTLLVTLSADGGVHEFRYGNKAFAGGHNWKKFYQVLEREWLKLKEDIPAPVSKNNSRFKYRGQEEAGEEVHLNI